MSLLCPEWGYNAIIAESRRTGNGGMKVFWAAGEGALTLTCRVKGVIAVSAPSIADPDFRVQSADFRCSGTTSSVRPSAVHHPGACRPVLAAMPKHRRCLAKRSGIQRSVYYSPLDCFPDARNTTGVQRSVHPQRGRQWISLIYRLPPVVFPIGVSPNSTRSSFQQGATEQFPGTFDSDLSIRSAAESYVPVGWLISILCKALPLLSAAQPAPHEPSAYLHYRPFPQDIPVFPGVLPRFLCSGRSCCCSIKDIAFALPRRGTGPWRSTGYDARLLRRDTPWVLRTNAAVCMLGFNRIH